jgi:predicted NBD/HSP70 family sugar kinase
VLERLGAVLLSLLEEAQPRAALWALGVGLPGHVDATTGRPRVALGAAAWNGFPVGDVLAKRFNTDVLVESTVNLKALGEAARPGARQPLIFAAIGNRLELAHVAAGVIQRGADGFAGDIGHVAVPGHPNAWCACGNRGCLDAIASGDALARRLSVTGQTAADARAVARLAQIGNPNAVRALRDAGHAIGTALSAAIGFMNPGVLVVDGDLLDPAGFLLTAIREAIYGRANPNATTALDIGRSHHGQRAALIGALTLAANHFATFDACEARFVG